MTPEPDVCMVRDMAPSDPVNHPSHYTRTRLETIDVIEDMVKGWPSASAYRLGNVLKYLWRHRDKGDPKENLKKALWYLQRELDALGQPQVEVAKPLEQRSVVVEPLPPEKHGFEVSFGFKVGSRVRHKTLPDWGIGTVHAISSVYTYREYLSVRFPGAPPVWLRYDELELVE